MTILTDASGLSDERQAGGAQGSVENHYSEQQALALSPKKGQERDDLLLS